MTDYTLYYWPIPFRGQFVRAVLAHVHATWEEADYSTISALMRTAPHEQPVPHMGPPVLIDHAADVSLSQMPAILTYLGDKHGLIPEDAVLAALTDKIIADANDVLYEMTLHNGAQMWSKAAWQDYRPRLARWMEIFEVTGRRFGLSADQGCLLGTEAFGVADLVTHILWGTMVDKFPALRSMLDEAAPAIAGLSDRLARLPEQAALRVKSYDAYGDEWCSGQIEASLRAVI